MFPPFLWAADNSASGEEPANSGFFPRGLKAREILPWHRGQKYLLPTNHVIRMLEVLEGALPEFR